MTAPMSRKASNNRTSMEISFGGDSGILLPLHASVRCQTRRRERDDNAPAGEAPSTRRESFRTVPPLPACNPNSSDRSGTPRGAAAKARFCRNGVRGSRTIAPLEKTLHFAFEFRKGCFESPQSRIDDDGPLWIQPIQSEAHGLPEPPLDAITYDRRAERARNSETDARPGAYSAAVRPFLEAKSCK